MQSADEFVSEQDGVAVVDIAQPGYWQDPHTSLAAARRISRGYRITPFMNPGFLRYADVDALFRDDRLAAAGTISLENQGITDGPLHEWWRNSMLFNDPPVHTRLRALVSRAFTARRVAAMRPVTRTICDELLDELIPRGAFEFVGDFAHHVPIRVITKLLGVPEADYPTFSKWTAALSAGFNALISPEDRANVESAIVSLYEYTDGLIADKRRKPEDDLVTALIHAEEEGDRLNVDELKALIVGLLFAGHDTTKSLLSIGIKVLIDHPDVFAALRADPGLAEPVVEEILRYESPVIGTFRRAAESFEYGGLEIKENQLVVLSILSAHRDESHYPDADRFDIERKDKRHLAFGLGRHFCVGSALGRLEAQEGLSALAERLPEPRVAVDNPSWIPYAGIRRYRELPLELGSA